MRQALGGTGRGLTPEQIRQAHAMMASGVPVLDVASRFNRSAHTIEQLRSDIKRDGLEMICRERARRLRRGWEALADREHTVEWFAANDARFRSAMEANPTERPKNIILKSSPVRTFVNQGGLG